MHYARIKNRKIAPKSDFSFALALALALANYQSPITNYQSPLRVCLIVGCLFRP